MSLRWGEVREFSYSEIVWDRGWFLFTVEPAEDPKQRKCYVISLILLTDFKIWHKTSRTKLDTEFETPVI